jgi:PAT family beta-lactamase induction signal transducer AmpG
MMAQVHWRSDSPVQASDGKKCVVKSSRSITDTQNGRYMLFGLLYFVQGAMLAYMLVFNNLYLRHFGASAGQLALLNGLLVIPFILKMGIGILSDRTKIGIDRAIPLLRRGHRVPYVTSGLVAIAAGALVARYIHPVEMYPLFLAMALFIAFGLSIFDTVIDGLAVDVTPADQQRFVQGAMVIGRAIGLVLLAAIYGRVIEAYGWSVVFGVVFALALIPLPLMARVNEPATRSAAQAFDWGALGQMWKPETGRFALYAIFYAIPVYGTNAIITLFANEGLGSTLTQVGDVAALAGFGMLLGGTLAVVISRRTSIWRQATLTGAAVSSALLLIALGADLDNLVFITFVWGVCLSAADFVYVTLSMARSDRRMGAGQFAIFMAISNVGTAVGQFGATALIDTISFRWIFAGMAVLNLLVFPILAAMRADDRKAQALLDQPAVRV